MHYVRILSQSDIAKALPMRAAIDAMKEAFGQSSGGGVHAPPRSALSLPGEDETVLIMPAFVSAQKQFTLKVVSMNAGDASRGFPYIQALVLVVDVETGAFKALMDGSYLTALRTGAASGAATDLLARPDSEVLAVFGTGAQAITQIEAVRAVRTIKQLIVFGTSNVESFAEQHSGIAGTSSKQLREADIICTATSSATAVFDDAYVKPGAHINGIGVYLPTRREIPAETLSRSRIFIDEWASMREEAGDILLAIQEGAFLETDIAGELGDVVNEKIVGREQDEQITCFKSVGLAVQDAVAAKYILDAAEQKKLGQQISF